MRVLHYEFALRENSLLKMLALRIFLIRSEHFFQDYKAMNFISHVRNQYRTTNLCPTQSYAFFKNSSKNRDFTRLLPELDLI